MNHIDYLYGQDQTNNIVKIEKDSSGQIVVFSRHEDSLIAEAYPFEYFCWSTKNKLNCDRVVELNGNRPYKYLNYFDSVYDYKNEVKKHLGLEVYEGQREEFVGLYTQNDPATQFMIHTGMTCFKGMKYNDPRRLQLDIETYTKENFPNAERPNDCIIIVSVTTNRNDELLFHTGHVDIDNQVKCTDERNLLIKLIDFINRFDPDIIEGHNIYNFDLPYIAKRCEINSVDFNIGRNGSEPFFYPSKFRSAERVLDYTCCKIYGRDIVDTFHMVMAYDAVKRKMPGHGLKVAAKYFGFAKEDRTYVEGSEIPSYWDNDQYTLLKYALDDAIETKDLSNHLGGSTFYQTQFLPLSYEKCVRLGNGQKIELLFVREYYRQKHSLPKPEEGKQEAGGLTKIFRTGLYGPILYADVESLYPSIMLNYNIQPERDDLKLFPRLLSKLTDLRFQTKALMNEAEDKETKDMYDGMQGSFKIFINSFYGALGFKYFIFNDFSEADRVATTGQDNLTQLCDRITKDGGTVIEIDTDGVLFVPGPNIEFGVNDKDYVLSLSNHMPKGIKVGFDGRFLKMLSIRKKNYALLNEDYTVDLIIDDSVKIKGSSLMSRGLEPFLRDFIHQTIYLLLEENFTAIQDMYTQLRKDIIYNKLSVKEVRKAQTLGQSLEEYSEKIKTNPNVNQQASYEIGLRLKELGWDIRKGDRIEYYVSLPPNYKDRKVFEKAKHVSEFDNDLHREFYLDRLETTKEKFDVLFTCSDFKMLFDPNRELQLFPEFVSDIKITNKTLDI